MKTPANTNAGEPAVREPGELTIDEQVALAVYEGTMGQLERSSTGRYTVRQFDGMDGCWCDDETGPLFEMIELWLKRTDGGTERIKFMGPDIDYYAIFPAETRMKWDGSPGREMFR